MNAVTLQARSVKFACARDAELSSLAVDVCDTKELLVLFAHHGKAIRIFHFESATNPSGKMLDFSVLPKLVSAIPYHAYT